MTASDAVCQQLLFPLVLDFSKPDVLKLKEVKAQLEKAGFRFSVMEEETIEITGIPSGFESEKIPAVLIQLISDIENDIPQTQFNIQEVLAKSLAKSLAIKSGVSLNKQEQEHMIHQLFACKEPTVCPNNKKVVITLDIQEIANKF
jgi:DNA mismatch repair protein MutL